MMKTAINRWGGERFWDLQAGSRFGFQLVPVLSIFTQRGWWGRLPGLTLLDGSLAQSLEIELHLPCCVCYSALSTPRGHQGYTLHQRDWTRWNQTQSFLCLLSVLCLWVTLNRARVLVHVNTSFVGQYQNFLSKLKTFDRLCLPWVVLVPMCNITEAGDQASGN